jgi:predicted DNA-binding transcriptional regulator YafY
VIPLKIFQSVQGGRQYLAAYSMLNKKINFFRVDNIISVKLLETVDEFGHYQNCLKEELPKIWGVATGQGTIEHIEMILTVEPKDNHIAHRLEREKRCGKVEKLEGNQWRFSADVYDAWELMPWLRTFIGRISSLVCSNKKVEEQFWADYSALTEMYGGDNSAVS